MGGVWLALDTATDIASVAVGQPPAAQSGAHVRGARRHAADSVSSGGRLRWCRGGDALP